MTLLYVAPRVAMHHAPDSLNADREPFGKVTVWCAARAVVLTDVAGVGVGQLGLCLLGAAVQACRVQAHAVRISTRCTLGVLAQTVGVATQYALRVLARPMIVTTGQTLGVQPSAALVATGKPLRMATCEATLASQRSPFGHHVSHIGGMVAQEQMTRTDTERNVAAVKYPQAVRDGSVCQFPGDAMGPAVPFVNAYRTVPTHARTSPKPAAKRAVYFGPKQVNLLGGILRLHRQLTPAGVRPPAVDAVRGPFAVDIIPRAGA